MQLKPIEEQVVALMGASSGIGREATLRFVKRGAKVVVAARNERGLGSLVDEIRDAGGSAIAVPADTSDFERVKVVANRADEDEDYREAGLEVDEAVHHPGEHEVQRPQPQDREGVGAPDDERARRDGEGRRDGVDGKDHIRRPKPRHNVRNS